MKQTATVLIFWLLTLTASAQEPSDYYQIRKPSHQEFDRLVMRYAPYLAQRWYVSLEGFGRTDNSQLDNSLRGLLSTESTGQAGWSALIGFSYRNRWAAEAGYAKSPIHNHFWIANAPRSLEYTFPNEKQGIILRGKWRVLSTSPKWERSGFWVTGGVWLIPNAGQETGRLSLEGYAYKKDFHVSPDTLLLLSSTRTNNQPTGLVELGLEYNIRISSRFEMGAFARKYWGIGNSLSTNIAYVVNSRSPQLSTISGDGTGMSYGVALRYTYSRRFQVNSVHELKGKLQHGIR